MLDLINFSGRIEIQQSQKLCLISALGYELTITLEYVSLFGKSTCVVMEPVLSVFY